MKSNPIAKKLGLKMSKSPSKSPKVETGKKYMKKAWYGKPSKGAKMGLSAMGGY